MALVLTADANPGTASWAATAGSIFAVGSVTMTAQTVNELVAGVLSTDLVLTTVESDDTGATLSGIAAAKASAGQIAIKSVSAPTANDGVVTYVVIRPG